MTQKRQRLAQSLERIRASATDDLIRSADMTRTDRERAQAAGWLHPIIKGWYIVGADTSAQPGNTVLWFSHFWQFVQRYLEDRFGDGYCLNAEASLDLHAGATTVPKQLIVMTRAGGAHTIELLHDSSIQTYPDADNLPDVVAIHHGIRTMTLPNALCRITPRYFTANPVNVEIALNLVSESELSRSLISGRNTRAASRLVGAYQFMGSEERARRIKQVMQTSVGRISVVNPFETHRPLLGSRPQLRSPQVGRLEAMWASMRTEVIDKFPSSGTPIDNETYLARIEDIYQHDAYNSLSIEGYRVTPEIIEKVRTGAWDPEKEEDREHIAAMAAKGYLDAFKAVRSAIESVHDGQDPARIAEQGIHDWYQALFDPSVQAGILDAVALAGFRSHTVYIKGSNHVPPPSDALMDSMETFFRLLANEPSAAVRAVLGHFIFVFIHPYPDGNGRVGRFLMNLMLAAGNYPWTVIRLANRDQYMGALEQASVHGNIGPFADFVAQEMQVDWIKKK